MLEDELDTDLKNYEDTLGEDQYCLPSLSYVDVPNLLEKELTPPSKKKDFIQDDFYTLDDLTEFHQANGSVEFKTRDLNDYLSFHVRYLVEVFLLQQPVELANVLLWVAAKEKKAWTNQQQQTFPSRGELVLFKNQMVVKLITHLQKNFKCKNQTHEKTIKSLIETLGKQRSLLPAEAYHVFLSLLSEKKNHNDNEEEDPYCSIC
jgi:hypothetical protein